MVKIKIADLRPHILNILGRINTEHIQQAASFIVDGSNTDSLILPHAERVAQRCIRQGSDDRIGVRVAMPGDIYFAHKIPPEKKKTDNGKQGMKE